MPSLQASDLKKPILQVSDLKKIYTTRFGGQQVQALSSVNFAVEAGGICGHHGRVRQRQDHAAEYPGRPG